MPSSDKSRSGRFLVVVQCPEDDWTMEEVYDAFNGAIVDGRIGVAPVIADELSGGWADAMLDACSALDLLDTSAPAASRKDRSS